MNTNCYLCNSTEFEVLEGTVRDYPERKVLKCKKCGLVFLDSFDHIDINYYEDSNMLNEANLTVEKWTKQNYKQNLDRSTRLMSFLSDKIVLDVGCGDGGFLNNIKPFVRACAGIEQSEYLRQYIIDNYNIQVFPTIEDMPAKNIEIITMFHVIEHFKDPIQAIKKLGSSLVKNGVIYLETPNANDILLNLYDCKAFKNFTYWGCHLFLFTKETLKDMIERAGYRCTIKQTQRYPLSNHLYWLTKGLPNGHNKLDFLNSSSLKEAYESILSNLGMCDTLTAYITKE